MDLNMPIVYPGDVQEAIDLGRHAIAMSRACGVWVGIKLVEAVADGTGSVDLHNDDFAPVLPVHMVNGQPWVPRPNGNIITPYTREIEREFPEVKRPIEDIHRAIRRASDALDRMTEHDLVWPPEGFFERREFGFVFRNIGFCQILFAYANALRFD